MATLLLDPEMEQRCRDEYPDRFTEAWGGVEVMPPLPNDEHQELQLAICMPLYDLFQISGLGRVRPGINLAMQHKNWRSNYRGPDVVVYLNSNSAVNHGTHWVGGPDFLVEIISDGEDPHAKLAFYAAANTHEVLIVERNPWAIELFRLTDGQLTSVGRSQPQGDSIKSSTLALTFRLVSGPNPPQLEISDPARAESWLA